MILTVLLAVLASPLLADAAPARGECADWPTESRPPQQIVLVVDATDGLSRAQRDDLWSRIRPLADQATPDSVFHIYEITDVSERGFRRVASVERPPHWCEVGFWRDNPRMRKRQWRSRYLQPLRSALARAVHADPSDSSAILQGIQAAARHFANNPDASPADGHLILVSDLMQNRGVNFYEGIPAFADFAETAFYQGVRTRRLHGVRLTVLRLPTRTAGADQDALLRFWTDYFESHRMRGVRRAFFGIEGLTAHTAQH